MNSAKFNGKNYYAIPNNNIIGEYTYMLLDKELMDKYSQQGYIKNGEVTESSVGVKTKAQLAALLG